MMIDLTPYFIKATENDTNYQEALSIVRNNSRKGNVWVIGGLVYRNIVKELYNKQTDEVFDFDFIVEKPVKRDQLKLPSGWKIIKTGLGEPRFIKDDKQIDLVELDNSINPPDRWKVVKMNSNQKIESYFRRVMLTVQAIAYDVNRGELIGKVGISAIERMIIEVNNMDECISFCKRRNISIRDFINSKKQALGFEVIYPNSLSKQM